MNKRKYRVGYLINSIEIGGGNRSLEVLTRGLENTEFDPFFVAPANGPMVDLIRNLNFSVDFHEMNQPELTRIVKTGSGFLRWIGLIRKHKLSMIHANGLYNARSIMPAAAVLGIPVVCHIRFAASKDVCTWIFKNLPKPRGFIYISRYMKDTVHPFLQSACPSSENWVVHNGVNTAVFSPEISSNSVTRIGVVANFQEVKGHEDVLEMVRLLVERGVFLQCDLLGADILNQGRETVLKDLVREKGIEKQIRFRGHVNDIAEHIKQLDILLCASHEEPFGRCVIEGMACGKPVVATRVGGIPEILIPEENGIMVPPKDPGAMADAIERLIRDTSLRQRFGQLSRQRVESYFSHAYHVRQITDIYREVLGL